MATPEILIPALRQYRHNNGEGLVFGYDKDEVEKLVLEQQKTIENMAMLMRMMLSERSANRKAKEFLNNNGLMGSPLR